MALEALVYIEFPKHTERETLDTAIQAAYILRQWLGKHVQAPIYEIHSRATPRSLRVKCGVRLDEVPDVRNVNAHAHLASVGADGTVQRVVDVAAAWRIN